MTWKKQLKNRYRAGCQLHTCTDNFSHLVAWTRDNTIGKVTIFFESNKCLFEKDVSHSMFKSIPYT